jgi:transcriptional accessory protein Tex/SPT6
MAKEKYSIEGQLEIMQLRHDSEKYRLLRNEMKSIMRFLEEKGDVGDLLAQVAGKLDEINEILDFYHKLKF